MSKRVRYYYRLRPPGIGCQPENFIEMHGYDFRENKQVGEYTIPAHGWVEYPFELSHELCWKYDLYPADEEWAGRYNEWRERMNK